MHLPRFVEVELMKIRALKVFVPFKHRVFEQTVSIPDNNNLSSDFDDLAEMGKSEASPTVDDDFSGIGEFSLGNEIKLPDKLVSAFGEKFYGLVFNGHGSILRAIICGIDPVNIGYSEGIQKKMMVNLRNEMGEYASNNFINNNYRSYGYSSSSLQTSILSDSIVDKQTVHVMTDYMGINVAVLNQTCERYYWASEYDPNRCGLLLWERNDGMVCVLSEDCISHLFKNFKEVVSEIAEEMVGESIFSISKKVIFDGEMKQELVKKLKDEKIKDIRARAIDLELSILDSERKQKKKSVLIAEIYYQLTGDTIEKIAS